MRPAWGLAVLGLMFLASGVAADPAVTSIGAHEGEAVWAFSNPSNYTFVNATITGPGVSLATVLGSAGDTTQAEFAQANATTNIDLAGSPGDAMIANTSQSGVPANLKFQPTPSQLEDTFLHKGGGGNTNFGASSDLWVGYWGNPEWNRALIRLPTFPVPANATVVDARIELYLYAAATLDSASIAVHRVTTGWLELGATWNDYDGSNPWNASVGGGDFDPASVDVVAGITNATGWYAWNVTSLVRGWLAGTYANDGMLFRAVGDDARLGTGRKQFFASDAPNATLRPRFTILYVTADSTGLLDSRSLDAGGAATWQRIRWNATVPGGTSIEIRTRTGFSSSVDASWSAWSAPYASSGDLVASPAGRFLEYAVLLKTATTTSPVLHDVSVDYQRYASEGTVTTEPFLPAKLQGWGRFDGNWSGVPGTGAVAAYSQDGGASWNPVQTGSNLSGAILQNVRIRLTLTTDNTTHTPLLVPFSLAYSVSVAGGGTGGIDIPAVLGVPVWVLLLPFGVLAAWVLARDLRRVQFDPTDLFLILRDGRLVRRVGGEESPLQDELAVSGMFTLVARFVKDSFGGGENGGDLKSFRVDEKEIEIAKWSYLYLALIGTGAKPPELEENMVRFLKKLDHAHGTDLRSWDGLSSTASVVDPSMRRFLVKGYRRRPFLPHSKT